MRSAGTISLLTERQSIVTLSSMQPVASLAAEIRGLSIVAVVGTPKDIHQPEIQNAARDAEIALIGIDAADPAVSIEVDATLDSAELQRRVASGIAIQMLTSGTTGPPKRVPLSYKALNAGFSALGHYESDGRADVRLRGGVSVLSLPLLHVSGIFNLLNNQLGGRRIALLERFRVEDWVGRVEEHRTPIANLPPTAMRMVLDAQVPAERLASMKGVIAGTAPVPPELAEEFERTYGIPVLVVYGATEFGGGIAGWTIDDHRRYAAEKRGSVGRAHPGVELRIVDPDTGKPLPTDASGILEVRAPQVTQAGPDGWVRTTDLARIDAEGFLWIIGRADDVIIRGGFKVSTGTVAEVLKQHPSVRDAGVVGIPDPRLGQVPVAAIELVDGAVLDRDALLGWLRQRLSPYQVPVDVVALAQLPRTPSLKVSQPGLRELLYARV